MACEETKAEFRQEAGLGQMHVLGGIVTLLLWGFLFGAGLLVATLPYRMHISMLASASDVAATVADVVEYAKKVQDVADKLRKEADKLGQNAAAKVQGSGASGAGAASEAPGGTSTRQSVPADPGETLLPDPALGKTLTGISEKIRTSVTPYEAGGLATG